MITKEQALIASVAQRLAIAERLFKRNRIAEGLHNLAIAHADSEHLKALLCGISGVCDVA